MARVGRQPVGRQQRQGLIDAIFALTGIVYSYAEIAPSTANSTGGEPNGNIRNGYLYQADRVTLVDGSLTTVDAPIFNGTRAAARRDLVVQRSGIHHHQRPLHLARRVRSAVGRDPAAGRRRRRRAHRPGGGSRAYVNDHLADQPNFAILGDWNGFYFEQAQTQLTAGGVFTNLSTLLPEEERYSYLFDGNSQLIDNILVTGGLLAGASLDAVHINAEFTGTRPTDHDPQVALLRIAITPHDIALTGHLVGENLPAGTVVGTLSAVDTAGDVLRFALADDAGGRFAVDAVTGSSPPPRRSTSKPSPASPSSPGHRRGGAVERQALTIAVGDVNEAPVAAATRSRSTKTRPASICGTSCSATTATSMPATAHDQRGQWRRHARQPAVRPGTTRCNMSPTMTRSTRSRPARPRPTASPTPSPTAAG
jgi:hypothetical protein